MIRFFPLGMALFPWAVQPAFARETPPSFRVEKYHPILLRTIERVYAMDYAGAEGAIHNALPPSHPAGVLLRGLIHSARFNDLGDTLSLHRAQVLFQEVESIGNANGHGGEEKFYRGIARLQLSVLYSAQGKRLRAALKAASGIGELEEVSGLLEASLAREVYRYYRGRLLRYFSWLPFVADGDDSPREFLEKHHGQSHYFRSFFLIPLIWMEFDAGRYRYGLSLSQDFLNAHPDNRLFRSIRADFLYKLERHREAAEEFESLRAEYADSLRECQGACLPLGYLGAVGNLVRVYAAMGETRKSQQALSQWKAHKRHHRWLASSLREDLERFE